jgi:pyruvate formate lyase activating enzyme
LNTETSQRAVEQSIYPHESEKAVTRPDPVLELLRVQRYCINDGPGIRTTVFFKGCPLNCAWCHNPESIPRGKTLMYNDRLCTRCGLCASRCPGGVHKVVGNTHEVDFTRCTACGECLKACTAEALTLHGDTTTVRTVMEEVLKDKDYYDASGGGVTFSGGEPLMQPEAAIALAMACREHGVSVYLDTSGMAAPEVFLAVAGAVDGFLYDIKLIDTAGHREWTGAGNETILANYVTAIQLGKPLRMRVVIIPGITDTEENLKGLLNLAESHGFTGPVDLMPYHRMGAAKYRNMGLTYAMESINPPTPEQLESIRTFFDRHGISTSIQ